MIEQFLSDYLGDSLLVDDLILAVTKLLYAGGLISSASASHWLVYLSVNTRGWRKQPSRLRFDSTLDFLQVFLRAP